MAAKSIILCASFLFLQTISGQCVNYANSCGCGGYGGGYANTASIGINTSGGSLPITSSSPIGANGLTVLSNNDIAGYLCANGQLPLLSAVALDGTFPTAGSGSVGYSCGDGNIGITSVNGGYGSYGGYGAGYGLAGRIGGCGCGCNY